MSYEKQYVLVIDTKPFSLNNYEETLQGLMALNYIMKAEEPDFSFNSIMKESGKKYYIISKNTYNKIKSLTNIKGIYTYVKDKTNIKKAWSVDCMFSKILEKENVKGSIQSTISSYVEKNQFPKQQFYLDEKAVYAYNEIYLNNSNRNLMLTIDKEYQEKVGEVLNDNKYNYLNNVGVIIMESDTGKIRVLKQKDESEPNVNLAIGQIGYEPGSVYKIITLGCALDMGLININDKFYCSGEICKTVHGQLTIEEAFKKSCNDIFAQIGNRVGYINLMKYSKEMGLYNTVLDYYEENKNEASGAQPEETAGMNNIAIGQCMNVTPLQILGAVNTSVNDGIYIKPYIIEGISDINNNKIYEFKTEEKRVYSETSAKIVKKMMRQVVIDGTGKNAYIDHIYTGGKTGTSTGNNSTHGWFVGYFEMNNKNYTMVVFVPDLEDENYGGGNTCAPVFKDIVLKLNEK